MGDLSLMGGICMHQHLRTQGRERLQISYSCNSPTVLGFNHPNARVYR